MSGMDALIPELRDAIHQHLGVVAKQEAERLLEEYKTNLQQQFDTVLAGITLELFKQIDISNPFGKIVISLNRDDWRSK